MGQVVTLRRRKLNKDDLFRMRLPKRYWKATLDRISDFCDKEEEISAREIIRQYVSRLEKMRSRGLGIVLWGENGTGKTGIAAVVAKEYRRRFNTVLFVEAADLKGLVAGREYFDETETFWQRARTVDVLVLDDLGKGVKDSKEFGERLIDELIRTRNANQLVTIVTTNAIPSGKGATLPGILKQSTLHSLKEHAIAVNVRGKDMREEEASRGIRRMAD